jgi:haloalkane dehalogenase
MPEISIRIKGQIDNNWSDWIGGLTISHSQSGETVLIGFLRDQSAVYGVLSRLGDLGLQLISLNLTSSEGRNNGNARPGGDR